MLQSMFQRAKRSRILPMLALGLLLVTLIPQEAFAQTSANAPPSWMSFIAKPWIRTILLVIGFAAVVIELFVPTFGAATLVAVTSLVLFFVGSYSIGDSSWVEIIFFVAGALLLFIEVTIEGFGPVGVAGIASIAMGIVGSAADPGQGALQLAASLAIATIIGGLLVKSGYESKILSKSVLRSVLSTEDGYVANVNRTDLIGQEGVALTSLRPTGEIEVEGKRYNVQSEGEFIPKSSRVIVISVRNGQIFVRRKNG